MQGLVQWVNFIYLQRGDKKTKPPINPRLDPKRPLLERLAEVNNPHTWGTYQQATQRYRTSGAFGYQGIGFVFSERDPFCGVDFDKCRDPKTGEIKEWVLRIVRQLNSYTEISPSGTGLHVLIRASLVSLADMLGRSHIQHKDATNTVEVYDTERYFTITGKHLDGTPETIEERQDELVALYLDLFPEEEKHEERETEPSLRIVTLTLSDQEIVDRASRAANGSRFHRLWNGDAGEYRTSEGPIDESRADLALLAMLAYWTQKDAGRMEDLFKKSGLYRPARWDRPARNGETYGQGTIRIAISRCHSVYDPQWAERNKKQRSTSSDDDLDAHTCETGKRTFPVVPSSASTDKPGQIAVIARPPALTAQQHRSLLDASNRRMQVTIDAFLQGQHQQKMLLIARPPGTGKTTLISQLGDPTRPNGYNIAAIFDRRDMLAAAPSLLNYAVMQPCTSHNCDSADLANALAQTSRNTWSIHRKHPTLCDYGLQAQDQSRSKVYMLAHMKTKGPASHADAIWKDEADITRHIVRKRFSIEHMRQEDTRCYSPQQTASLLLRQFQALLADTEQQELARRRAELDAIKQQGRRVTRFDWQRILSASVQLDSPAIFEALHTRSGGHLRGWLGAFAQSDDYTNTHPFVEVDPYDPNAMHEIEDLPPVVLPYIVRALIAELGDWQRTTRTQGPGWNGHLRVGPGPKGYYLYVTDKITFTPDADGQLPPIVLSDGTITKKLAGLLYDIPESDIDEDRESVPVAANTVLVEPTNSPRYGKMALLSTRADANGQVSSPDLDRAVGHCSYLLNQYDPQRTQRLSCKVGLISFKDCVDTLGDALGIPKHRRMWFWGCRGSNALEDCTTLLVVGTPSIKPDELVEYARDLYRRDPSPISGETEHDSVTGRLRYKDARVQELAEHMTNGELEQCAHRIRPIQHAGRTIINLSHGTIGHLTGARIVTDDLPFVTKAGQPRKQANLEEAIRRLVSAYQQLTTTQTHITVKALQQGAGVRTETARQWLADQRHSHSDVTENATITIYSTVGNAGEATSLETPVSEYVQEQQVTTLSSPRVSPPLQTVRVGRESPVALFPEYSRVQEARREVLVSASSVGVLPFAPPQRPTLCCDSTSWHWTGEKFVCGVCSVPRRA